MAQCSAPRVAVTPGTPCVCLAQLTISAPGLPTTHNAPILASMGNKKVRELDRESVRTAVLHLVELAAAFEGRGMDLEPADGSAADIACLEAVVKLLLQHRQGQRRLQRRATAHVLLDELAGLFVEFKGDKITHQQINDRMDLISAALSLTIGKDFDYLTPEPGEITREGGAVEAAKKAIAEMLGVSKTFMSEVRRAPAPFGDVRLSFGRWVFRRERLAYVKEVHEEVLRQTESVLLPYLRLGKLVNDEVVGLVVDRRIEGLCRLACEHPNILRALVNKERWETFAELGVREVQTVIKQALEEGGGTSAAASLPEPIKNRLETYFAARRQHGAEADETMVAKDALEDAVASSSEVIACDIFRKYVAQFGEPDTPPTPLLPA